MDPKQHRKQGALGRRLMWTLLAAIAVAVVMVLFFYGIREPEKGPGNLPPSGGSAPHSAAPAPRFASLPHDGAFGRTLAALDYKRL
ncbi:hypothetical protein M2282_004332 [Variovorax boronicumulans]|uniref:hypothetical protein n=1 Tax=Variovorax boronicumulans TaxID=436515 RepID=UPI0024763F56|nr:hypothetical protein [Variovorax boronicumulans]MDH6169168.1 hypothetical protein [Variovorax boronicumulans]